MADTHLDTVNNLKRGHALEIVDALRAVTVLIEGQPDLWFGGLPSILTQLIQQTDHHIGRLRADFDLNGSPVPG